MSGYDTGGGTGQGFSNMISFDGNFFNSMNLSVSLRDLFNASPFSYPKRYLLSRKTSVLDTKVSMASCLNSSMIGSTSQRFQTFLQNPFVKKISQRSIHTFLHRNIGTIQPSLSTEFISIDYEGINLTL
jgi:hypothetical protein